MEKRPNTIPWLSITENWGNDILDFSVNTNPLGMPHTVLDHFSELGNLVQFYPDPNCTTLKALLSEKYAVPANAILCGSGADDLLYRLVFARKPRKALILAPTFEEYHRALQTVSCEVYHHSFDAANGFKMDEAVLSDIHGDLDMVFLCNPNNPTGQLADPCILEQLIQKCRRSHILLVVDECFMEFLPEWQRYSVKQQAAVSEELIVIDAFTKTYSLAGFRLGYCISGNHKLLEDMKLQGQEFGVSAPAQFAGICALMDHEYLPQTHAFLHQERAWLHTQLCSLNLDVIPSQTNYFLFRSQYPNLRKTLLTQKIKVRDCSQFYGLGPNYCRIAVKQHSENEAFIQILKNTLEHPSL